MKKQELEKQLEVVLEKIKNYVPATKWEAANDRTLKRMHLRRKALERAIDKK
jgi:hypothetical protein